MDLSRGDRKRGYVDDSILLAAIKWGGMVVLAVGGWIGRGMHADIKELKDSSGKCELKLQEFRTHVSENYAKDASVQQSLARLHDRLDEGFKEIRDQIRGVK